MKKDCETCVHQDVCYRIINRGQRNPARNGYDCKHYTPIDNVDRCVCCGAPIPEGRMVCPICEGK